MTTNEVRAMNIFNDYYDELKDMGRIGEHYLLTDSEEYYSVAAGIATALTINKLLKEDRHNETV